MTIELMRTLLALAVLVGCSGPGGSPDAAVDARPDAPPRLDCESYCERIEASCTGETAQYPDREHCMAACASFKVEGSTVTDAIGNTLGCRIHHTGLPSKDAATDCAKAGPAGDRIEASPPAACSDDNVCVSFCALQIEACGSLDEPLPGDPKDSSGNSLYQYRNMANCLSNCAMIAKTHAYSTASAGDSLACRLNRAIRATIPASAGTECANTGLLPVGPCEGTPTP